MTLSNFGSSSQPAGSEKFGESEVGSGGVLREEGTYVSEGDVGAEEEAADELAEEAFSSRAFCCCQRVEDTERCRVWR